MTADSQSKEQDADRFYWEQQLHSKGFQSIAGIDEAGRGPLAGPVVAAAVTLPAKWYSDGLPESLKGINDSKKLTPRKRTLLFDTITEHQGVHYGIAQIEANEIDRVNILKATHRAMAGAVQSMKSFQPGYALVDGLPVQGLPIPHTAIVKGDAKSFSIAAASILAKEFRDRLMIEWDDAFPAYGFAKHKGYGTAQHRTAIAKNGPCILHRRSFLGNIQQQVLFEWDD